MRDFSNYTKQGPGPGRTVPYEVTELRNPDGTHPIVHLEHLGRTNASWLEELLATAGKKDEKDEKDDDAAAAVKRELSDLSRSREVIIKHCAKRLENAFFSDGTAASDADLPGFITAMPPLAFERMFTAAANADKYCEYPVASAPEQIAEK